jgi:single-strand DNA-binding protein
MLVIGRVTENAVVKQLKDERQVVNFSIAVNDWYKPKDSEQGVKVTTFFTCSYWRSTRIAERLKKGALVELFGRVSVNAYTNMQGEPKGTLNFHVNNIKIHQSPKSETAEAATVPDAANVTEPIDDLPF